MLATPITDDDLRETCPACQGSGKAPQPVTTQQLGGFGRREIPMGLSKCHNPGCVLGKVPTASGVAILGFLQDYARLLRS